MKKEKPKIVVFGTGGHTKSVIRIIEAEAKWDIYGLLDDFGYQDEVNDILGYKIVGYRNDISHLQAAKIVHGFVAIGDNNIRAKITNDLISKGIKITTIQNCSSWMYNSCYFNTF